MFFVCLQVVYSVPVLVCYYGHWCRYVTVQVVYLYQYVCLSFATGSISDSL